MQLTSSSAASCLAFFLHPRREIFPAGAARAMCVSRLEGAGLPLQAGRRSRTGRRMEQTTPSSNSWLRRLREFEILLSLATRASKPRRCR